MVPLYRRAFPNYESSYIIRDDGYAQRGGVDRKINLRSSRSVFIEEKFRDADYGDVLLERWSDRARRVPGWIQKNLLADYVAYVVIPRRTMLLLPYLDLRRAWVRNGKQWIDRYPPKCANNPGYKTEYVCIPEAVLLRAIVSGFALRWTEADEIPRGDAPALGAQLQFEFSL
jgi:hypothetical protein